MQLSIYSYMHPLSALYLAQTLALTFDIFELKTGTLMPSGRPYQLLPFISQLGALLDRWTKYVRLYNAV